jgi:phenylalanyl-tRNA synthetase beta chain
MTISYNWLSEFLPETIEPERLSRILTAIGLEVEHIDIYQNIKGGLNGLLVGEVVECNPHPNADKLKLTQVNIGNNEILQIICGAKNVSKGQKVIVATVGTTIYPNQAEPITMKVAKIRSIESYGMICAEDEIGISSNHDGIIVLNDDAIVGEPASNYFNVYTDTIFEIGLTPNRMDAMSHMGVARDVCAYLTHHNKIITKPVFINNGLKNDISNNSFEVIIENTEACHRYSGVSISNITIQESPIWLQNKLKAIGVRPINNIVDITNYVLHETGQPLHAFDADKISGNKIIVKKLPAGTSFITLDEKERKLHAEDLMICNEKEPMCIAGVFGGIHSGVSENTKNIFLESAWFHPSYIRKTSLRHQLRTDAASRFEKETDISNTVLVLKRAAALIQEIAGGTISSHIIDVYPVEHEKKMIVFKNHYLKRLSGKNYHPDAVQRILTSLGFEIIKEGLDEIHILVPFHKTDINIPADIVEEIIRIDGLDNIEIPSTINMSPAIDKNNFKEKIKEKISDYLVGKGFLEIISNSITNDAYFTEDVLSKSVKMMNNLSADLNTLRPSLLEPALEAVAYNINRKNTNLQLFEFGKVYTKEDAGKYTELNQLLIVLTGKTTEDSWQQSIKSVDLFTAKSITQNIFQYLNLPLSFQIINTENNVSLESEFKNKWTSRIHEIGIKKLQQFSIKQPVYCIEFNWDYLVEVCSNQQISFKEISKFPLVQRDLSIVIDKSITYQQIDKIISKANIQTLQNTRLFDVFESDKLGKNKKSYAINFTFLDAVKTLTDKEIDGMMNKLILNFEKELQAEIRK